MTPRAKPTTSNGGAAAALASVSTLTLGLAACASADTPAADASAVDSTGRDDTFCTAGSHLIALLQPTDGATPEATKTVFDDVAVWLDRAERSAPPAIADEVDTFVAAYRNYRSALQAVDYDLDAIFSTTEGQALAVDTSHSLTPPITDHWINVCGLSLGDEQPPPPSAEPPTATTGSDQLVYTTGDWGSGRSSMSGSGAA